MLSWPWCDNSELQTVPGPGLVVDLPPLCTAWLSRDTCWLRLVSRHGPGLLVKAPGARLLFSTRRRAWRIGRWRLVRLPSRWWA